MYPYSNPNLLAKSASLLKSIKWSSILDGTGKTLGVINQAIPVVYQIKPLVGNLKTIMKITSGLNNNSSSNIKTIEENNQSIETKSNSPIFYID